ncbi:MAG TPA: DUF3093 family protein [Streptosporangiaceae bacterium]|jgi:hypothetical protein|nr:DUF3093 family protein [Streptosporangiaceae bacterium]
MRVYHERLRVPVTWWLLGVVSVVMLGAGFLAGFDWQPALAVYGLLGAVMAAFLINWGRLSLQISDGELRVGKSRLPLAAAGEVAALDDAQTRALRGPRADPAAFMLIRPYLPRSVYVAVADTRLAGSPEPRRRGVAALFLTAAGRFARAVGAGTLADVTDRWRAMLAGRREDPPPPPYWLIATRQPAELAAAIETARPTARAAESPVA